MLYATIQGQWPLAVQHRRYIHYVGYWLASPPPIARATPFPADVSGDYIGGQLAGSKEIWVLAAVAWVLNPESMPSVITETPILNLDEYLSWSFDKSRHVYRVCIDAKRDIIFRDFLADLDAYLAKI